MTAIRVIAKLPTIAAMAYKHSIGQPYIYPQVKLSYAENFLHMMFATPCTEYKPPQAFVEGKTDPAVHLLPPLVHLVIDYGLFVNLLLL